MPIFSMTGFGRGFVRRKAAMVTCDIRSVNNRFLDIQLRLPRTHAIFETKIRKKISETLDRGRIELTLSIVAPASDSLKIVLDKELVGQYLARIKELGRSYDLEGDVPLRDILAFDGVLRAVENPADNEDGQWPMIEEAVSKALKALLRMRKNEGSALKKDIQLLVRSLSVQVRAMEKLLPAVTKAMQRRLALRVENLSSGAGVDPQRLAQEIAFLLSKSDVNEEIARLKGHLEHLESSIKEGSPVGKRLDFLLQELHREITTYSNKIQGLSVSPRVVEAKLLVEKIREQVQNVE